MIPFPLLLPTMLISRLHKFLIPNHGGGRSHRAFWFSLSVTFSVLFAWLALKQAFSGEYVVQDDARQHVFWMQRFTDPDLFPQDLIADYFQSVAPAGYTAVYQVGAALGIPPLVFNKLLPLGLGLIVTGYSFGIALEILPIPLAGFITSLVLNQSLWMKDDLVSATPRAFLYPLFLAFLYYLLRRDAKHFWWGSLLPCLASIALLGLFYPQYVFVAVVVLGLRLLRWQGGRLHRSDDRRDSLFCALGLGTAFLVLLPFALNTSEFGPAVTAAEARTMPEFLRRGRSSFFVEDPLDYWLFGRRSGFLPRSLFTPVTGCFGLLLPLVLRFSARFPLVSRLRGTGILLQIPLAALILFLAAHGLLFRLHLPSRYTGHSLRIAITLAAGITLTVLLDGLLRWAIAEARSLPKTILPLGLAGLLGIAVVGYPLFVSVFPLTAYERGTMPELYQFFSRQPRDSLIASLMDEAGNLPTFSGRSVLIAKEYAIPYQVGYYRQFRQRTQDLIRAQYSPDPAVVKQFVDHYGVDFWMVDRRAFSPDYLARSRWLRQYNPVTDEALANLTSGKVPLVAKQMNNPRCQRFATPALVVLESQCILKTDNS